MREMKCNRCGYTWKPRVEQPKKCPGCLDWLIKVPKRKPIPKT